MARYIDADKIIEFITKGLNDPDNTKAFGYDAIVILTEIEYSPTADVVPKSEVDRWRFQLEAVLEEIPETKQEVAREIFEEIEKHRDKKHGVALLLPEEIAELKKKYTEEQNNENQSKT